MKKILLILLILTTAFSLTSCKKRREEKQREEEIAVFNTYLDGNSGLSRDDINRMFSSTNSSIDMSNIKIQNIYVSGISDNINDYDSLYIWQKADRIYYAPYSQTYNKSATLTYIDLDELVEYNQNSINMNAADVLDEAIETAISANGLPFSFTLDDVLSLTSFGADDFEYLGEGIFELKNSALYKKIENITDGMITSAQIKQMLIQYGIDFKISVEFDGEKITSYLFDLTIKQQGVSINVSLELKLKSNGFELIIKSPFANITLTLTASNSGLSATVVGDITDGSVKQNINASLLISATNLTFDVMINSSRIAAANITISESAGVYAINGSISYLDGSNFRSISISSNEYVNIPLVCQANESTAVNGLTTQK